MATIPRIVAHLAVGLALVVALGADPAQAQAPPQGTTTLEDPGGVAAHEHAVGELEVLRRARGEAVGRPG